MPATRRTRSTRTTDRCRRRPAHSPHREGAHAGRRQVQHQSGAGMVFFHPQGARHADVRAGRVAEQDTAHWEFSCLQRRVRVGGGEELHLVAASAQSAGEPPGACLQTAGERLADREAGRSDEGHPQAAHRRVAYRARWATAGSSRGFAVMPESAHESGEARTRLRQCRRPSPRSIACVARGRARGHDEPRLGGRGHLRRAASHSPADLGDGQRPGRGGLPG